MTGHEETMDTLTLEHEENLFALRRLAMIRSDMLKWKPSKPALKELRDAALRASCVADKKWEQLQAKAERSKRS